MSKKKNINVPSAGGGIFHVSTEESKGFKLKPIHVIGFTAAVVVFELVLHFYGSVF